ncbi:MBL fold metallo-hydrolase, partial [Caldivirga sp.]|uniref:MBL fold metallo-hydrolase n=1 Tax=Caldivirga sp. TaxID=2080243 RepID=UPI003D12BD5F
MRFNLLRRFYGGLIRPTGISELRELGILPDLSNYQSPTVFITHLHLDHIGLLSNLPANTTVYLPDFYDTFINWFRNRADWLQFMEPRIGITVNKLTQLMKYGNVTAIPVIHSAYPAYAYLYDNGGVRIMYTGDFRLDSLLKYVDKDLYTRIYGKVFPQLFEEPIDVDLLIIEGTNFQTGLTPMTGEHVVR